MRDAVRGPERPRDEHRLEEQSNQTSLIGIEAESADTVHILTDVPRENRHVEQRKQHATKSIKPGLCGSQEGTCARNSCLAIVK